MKDLPGEPIQNHIRPDHHSFDRHYPDNAEQKRKNFPFGKIVGPPIKPASNNVSVQDLENLGYVGLYQNENDSLTLPNV